MNDLDIGFDEVVEEIRRLDNENPQGFTIYEMGQATGFSDSWCRNKMRNLIREKKAMHVGKKITQNSRPH